MELDRRKEAPSLYVQVAKELAEQIESGEYATGELIPSEKELQNKYKVSRMTIRQAVGELVNRNYIECRRGIGTIVIYGKIKENIKHVVSLTEEMAQQGIQLKTVVCTLVPGKLSAQAAVALGKREQSPCYILSRTRFAKEKPLVYSETYLCIDQLPMDASLYQESLYSLLRDEFHIIIARGEDVLEAVLSEGTVSTMLRLPDGYPVFKRTRVTYDQNDSPVEYSVCYYPGDQYKCSISL